jgi:hypothetical protein
MASVSGLTAVPRGCENAGMDDTKPSSVDDPSTPAAMGRRAFFSRALLVAGAAAGLTALTGCPGGGDDDEDDDDDDDD